MFPTQATFGLQRGFRRNRHNYRTRILIAEQKPIELKQSVLPQHIVYNFAMEVLSLPDCLAQYDIDCLCETCRRKS